MNRLIGLLYLFSLGAMVHGAQPETNEVPSGPDRIVQGRLLNVDGSPCANAIVMPIGIDRIGIIMEEDALKNTPWQYRTDKEGKFTVRFGRFFNGNETATTSTLGFSFYHLIAIPGNGDAGAVSGGIGNPRSNDDSYNEKNVDEWGGVHNVGDKPMEITMQRKDGIVVEGTVSGKTGQEMAGMTVTLHHDLHAATHTGGGGEIFNRKTTTDAGGHYRFEHVYPAKFYLGCEREDKSTTATAPTAWLRTRVRDGAWQNDCIDEIDVKPGDKLLRIDIGLAPGGQFVYRGFVTDEAGKPIEGAEVVLGYSHHAQIKNYDDFHSFLNARTAADGSYEIKSGTGWVRFISARKEGYQDGDINSDLEEDNGRKMPPGQYDFKLKKKSK